MHIVTLSGLNFFGNVNLWSTIWYTHCLYDTFAKKNCWNYFHVYDYGTEWNKKSTVIKSRFATPSLNSNTPGVGEFTII